MMAAQQQNAESIFEPPTYSQKTFATRNGSYKLFLQVHNFNGYVRVGISKQIWCEEANDYVHAKKGHCHFPLEACDALKKYLPIAKTEADRLDKKVNGHAKAPAFAGNGRFAGAGATKLYQRGANASTSVANGFVSERQPFGKRRADDYKTDGGSEEEANAAEQGSPKKLCTDDSEEAVIVPQKTQALERFARR
jgi:hypothetical protein